MVENKQVKMLWDLQIQTDKLMMANPPAIAVADKHHRTAVVTDITIMSSSNIRET